MIHRSYTPVGAALDLFKCRAPEVLISGPAGTGKSRAALEKVHAIAMANPRMRGLILRKTQTSLGSTTLVTWREHVVAEALAEGLVDFYGGSAQHSPQYRYKNGSTIVVGGMDKATRIMSSEYDIAYVSEAIELTVTDWEAITTRLRNGRVSFQQLIADTNPDTPTHWLKQRCDRGQTVILESRHEDNPTLFDQATGQHTPRGSAYMGVLDNLTGVRYHRLRKGLWVAAEGVIYDGWDPAVHLVDRFTPPAGWDYWWTVDFGFVHPFVWQAWAQDPDGRLYLVREIFHTKRLVEDHAKQILALAARENLPRPRAVICDHDAEGRATLEKHLGMSTMPAKKAVLEGIQAVAGRLKAAGDGRPRVFLMRDALVERDPELVEAKKPTCTVEEIPGYVWDLGAGKKTREAPLKEMDDGCDAMRYVVAQNDLGSRPTIRFM